MTDALIDPLQMSQRYTQTNIPQTQEPRESTQPHRAVLKSPEHQQHISAQGFRQAPINSGVWTNSGQGKKLRPMGVIRKQQLRDRT